MIDEKIKNTRSVRLRGYEKRKKRKERIARGEEYKRRDHGPNSFILVEDVASQDLWIWHAFFGVSWSNNDIIDLQQSPLFNDLKEVKKLEILFVANGLTYPWGYYLVDEIYPELATLVKTISEPSNDKYKQIRYRHIVRIKRLYDDVRVTTAQRIAKVDKGYGLGCEEFLDSSLCEEEDENLLKFHACKDAKSLWEAIKKRFGGNKESKKMQKTILKRNYENFAASSQEGLDKTYDRFQKLISQLEIHGEMISQEDANLKLLRSLPSSWNNITLIMRNKSDLDTLSMDDLYNSLKVYESEIKIQSSSSLNSYNVAFVSSDNSSSTNETVNTIHSDNKDLEQIDTNDLEKMNLKCRHIYYKCLGCPNGIGGYDWSFQAEEELTNFALIAYTSQDKNGHGYDSQINESDLNDIRVNEIPPPYTGNYMPPRADLSFAGLDSFIFKSKESDSKDENVFKPKEVKKTVKSSLEKLEFVNARNTTVENKNKVEKPRKFSQSPRDCDFYENKMVLNNKGKIIGPIEIRLVYDNTVRVNHQNTLTRPHPKRNFVPTTVLTKSRQVPVNAAKQSSHRAATLVSAARVVNIAASRPNVNNALPTTYSYFKAYSLVRRPFNQKLTNKTNNFNEKVDTAKVNNVTTIGLKAVVSVAKGNRNNTVKSSACWIWRPKGNLIDHISKDNRSYTHKRFNYVDPQRRLKHMTRNKSYLTYYQEFNGGFVAFRGNAKGGKITGKGKIRTGKLDFTDVYFVKEFKFNLLSVSQMCDKKNSVVFTDTGCVVLSHDFKLLNESQVLLKVPRNHNMYSFDLKNVVPVGGLTCLFAKATLNEFNLWNIRLGRINFKTMNKLVRGNLVRGIENQMDHKVKTIRCDNGTEFKNRIMNEFFEMKGYFINSKAFRVFNTRTRFVEENLHINFLENKPNIAGTRPNWMFDIDTLTMSMNYQPVFAGNQTNGNAGTKENINAKQARKKIVHGPQYVFLPLLNSDSQGPKSSEDEVADDV
uniref:Ribonuclease H-like domain-containing protein n=1 Tax=Tanacetum cinerariifolium TaxID=118510 RepID=A0A6L2K7Q9_TANCI|nr:ribonuclease H-like domain-containing protein [Tanacetum cinerariifolium]